MNHQNRGLICAQGVSDRHDANSSWNKQRTKRLEGLYRRFFHLILASWNRSRRTVRPALGTTFLA